MWSFGVLIYEVYTSGLDPYVNVDVENAQLRKMIIAQKVHLTVDYDIQEIVDEVRERCHIYDPDQRPSFADLVATLRPSYEIMRPPSIFEKTRRWWRARRDKKPPPSE